MSDLPFTDPEPMAAALPAEEGPSLARSASIIAFGNIASRLLGLGRETTIAYFFGASGLVSAFQAASTIPTMIFDLLVGGMLSAALVPVFSDYARQERRREFGQVVGTVLSVIGLVVAGLVVLIMLLAEPLAHLVAGGLSDELLAVTASLLRIMTPAIWFLAISGVVTGALFALKRFTFPAFAAAVYNLGIIIAALLLNERFGIYSLAVGVLLGSVLQFLLQAPDLLRARVVISVGLRHPALRRIWLLYLPILFGLLVSQVQVIIDRRLASGTGEQSLAWMRDATTLFQLPHGLVAVAISLAALPSLAQYFAAGNDKGFRATLGRGLRTHRAVDLPARRLSAVGHRGGGVGVEPVSDRLDPRVAGLAAELHLLRPQRHADAGHRGCDFGGYLSPVCPAAGQALRLSGAGFCRFDEAHRALRADVDLVAAPDG